MTALAQLPLRSPEDAIKESGGRLPIAYGSSSLNALRGYPPAP